MEETPSVIQTIGEAIVEALTSALGMIKDVASAVLQGFNTLFFQTNATSGAVEGLSPMAIALLCFGGVAIAVGIGRLCLNLVRAKVGR